MKIITLVRSGDMNNIEYGKDEVDVIEAGKIGKH